MAVSRIGVAIVKRANRTLETIAINREPRFPGTRRLMDSLRRWIYYERIDGTRGDRE